MVKYILPYTPPRQKGESLKKYICHQTVLKQMVTTLSKMPYITSQNKKDFFTQVSLILKPVLLFYANTGFDSFNHFTGQLFTYLKGEATFIEDVRIMITQYDTPASSFYANKKYFELSLKECKTNIIVFPFSLETYVSAHANLLIIDKNAKVAWRIEPNAGSSFDIYDKYIDPHLLKFFKEYGIKYLYNFPGECPIWLNRIPIFNLFFNVKKPEYLPHYGLCMFIAVGKFIYGNRLTDEILKKFIIEFFKNEMKNICKL